MATHASGLTLRHMRALAWGGLALAVLLYGVTVVFVIAGWGRCNESQVATATAERTCSILLSRADIGGAFEGIGFGLLGVLFAGLGALLASRRHDNALGWIFLATGLVFTGNTGATVYSIHAAEVAGGLPGGLAAAVIAEVLGGPVVFAPFVLFFLLFPSGAVLSQRWRVVLWAAIASVIIQTLDLALHPNPLRLAPLQVNPIGLPWLTNDVRPWLQTPAFALLVLSLLAAVVSLVLRFRRSRGVERQQMKWFTTSSALVGLTFACAPLFWSTPQLEILWGPLFMLAVGSVPVAATIAILRYHLYDLGVLVNRALVYGALTAVLAGTYLVLVVLLQSAMGGLGGGSDIAVAGSTLAIAALFRPLRTRVQAFIDQHFYRRKYNASRTVEAFSANLRQETDLAALRGALLQAVQTTIQPATAAVWVRPDERPQ